MLNTKIKDLEQQILNSENALEKAAEGKVPTLEEIGKKLETQEIMRILKMLYI